MRMTNNLLIHNMLWNMNNNLSSMGIRQNQLASGKSISAPSDDPVGITKVLKLKSDIAENKGYKESIRDAKSWMEVSEHSLMDMKDILQRVRELAVQGANGVYTKEDTQKIQAEIDQLKDEIIVGANSTIAGRYIFSGLHTDKPLIDSETGKWNTFVDSNGVTKELVNAAGNMGDDLRGFDISVNEKMVIQTDLAKMFGGRGVDDPSKPKLIEDLEKFSAALGSGNTDKVNSFLGTVDDHLENVLAEGAQIGAKVNRVEFIENRIDNNTLSYTKLLSDVYDVDYSDAIIKFKSLESIYRASLSVGAKVMQPTLVDFIR